MLGESYYRRMRFFRLAYAPPEQGQTALIIGATGAVGKNLLKEILDSPHFTRVGEFGRRTTPLDTEGLNHTDKLVQKAVDFEKLAEAGFTDEKWDVIFITMGTSRKKAGSVEKFVKVDQDYVVDAARAAMHPDHKQRLVYLSTVGANRNSYVPYLKSKGQTEERLAALEYSDTIIFRPGRLLGPERGEFLPFEAVSQWILTPLSALSDSLAIGVKPLAKGLRVAGELGSSALPPAAEAVVEGGSDNVPNFTMVPNKGAIKLSQMQ